ncbi:uncharacterized protein LOC106059896 [Biomphalaria glabrata]|uniref:Uncharacterized protein LOC106059896 n=1 Tax=Biomphalaria glabrata TaxID=6526 RepID=A0A9W2ZXR8_BIOGL|nr:uncharacterized protein LOC106059896 [Biomphalaria glabrata]
MAIPSSLTEPVLMRIRLVIYGGLIFFSFFTFSGVAVMMEHENGCPLYMSALQVYTSSSCNFTMFVSIVFQLIYCVFRLISTGLLLSGNFRSELFLFNKQNQRYQVLLEIIFTFFTLVTACLLSSGVNQSCSVIECTGQDWYESSRTAQAGAWISTLLFVVLVIVGYTYLKRTNNLFWQTEAPTQDINVTQSSGQPCQVPPSVPYPGSGYAGQGAHVNVMDSRDDQVNYVRHDSSGLAMVPLEDKPPSYEEAVKGYTVSER